MSPKTGQQPREGAQGGAQRCFGVRFHGPHPKTGSQLYFGVQSYSHHSIMGSQFNFGVQSHSLHPKTGFQLNFGALHAPLSLPRMLPAPHLHPRPHIPHPSEPGQLGGCGGTLWVPWQCPAPCPQPPVPSPCPQPVSPAPVPSPCHRVPPAAAAAGSLHKGPFLLPAGGEGGTGSGPAAAAAPVPKTRARAQKSPGPGAFVPALREWEALIPQGKGNGRHKPSMSDRQSSGGANPGPQLRQSRV